MDLGGDALFPIFFALSSDQQSVPCKAFGHIPFAAQDYSQLLPRRMNVPCPGWSPLVSYSFAPELSCSEPTSASIIFFACSSTDSSSMVVLRSPFISSSSFSESEPSLSSFASF